MKKRSHSKIDGGILADYRLRIVLLASIIVFGVVILLIRAYILQIFYGEEHRVRISRQSIRRIRVPARRGKIFTSDLKLLAANRTGFNLIFYPGEMRLSSRAKTVEYMTSCLRQLATAIGRELELSEKQLSRHLRIYPGLPITVFQELTPKEIARSLECSRTMRGVDIQPVEIRHYPCGRLASHLIGSARLEKELEAADRKKFFYYVPDFSGHGGVEEAFEQLPQGGTTPGLRGVPGYSMVQVDSIGYVHRELIERIEPRHGNHVIMTIDSRAQALAEELLTGSTGAIVVVNGDNGDVICAASNPGFDLRKFAPRLSTEYYESLRNNPSMPLFNRAFQGMYTPGSIIKPLSALAFLNCGLSPAEKIVCDGSSRVLNVPIRCSSYRIGGHGTVNLYSALAKSCNDYLIEHATKIGLIPLARVLESAGIGQKTGIELAETAGTFPSDALKRRRYHSEWNNYDTALLSIGQGMIAISPLQAALFTAALGNGGIVWRPHIVERVVGVLGNTVYQRKPEVVRKLATTPGALEIVNRGMEEVVAHGSGSKAAVSGVKLYGKTGSAEVGLRGEFRLMTWFVAHLTYREKKFAIAIMIEDGISGGSTCAPLASEFFDRYLSLR